MRWGIICLSRLDMANLFFINLSFLLLTAVCSSPRNYWNLASLWWCLGYLPAPATLLASRFIKLIPWLPLAHWAHALALAWSPWSFLLRCSLIFAWRLIKIESVNTHFVERKADDRLSRRYDSRGHRAAAASIVHRIYSLDCDFSLRKAAILFQYWTDVILLSKYPRSMESAKIGQPYW